MTDCATIEPLLAAYADDAIEPDEGARVDAHLRSCPACAGAVAVQRQVRAVLRAQAMDLRDTAPPSLRSRVATHGRMAARRAPGRLAPWRAVPLSAAAALVIAVTGVVALGALAPRGAFFATQLALDHMKCLLLTGHRGPATPDVLQTAWKRDHGWAITIPAAVPAERLEFVALRRCLWSGGEMAHVLYMQGGHPASLYILPRRATQPGELAIMGYETMTWTDGARTYAVVSELPRESLTRLATYLRSNAR